MESIRSAIRRRSGLWNNQDFIRFWIGETIANFGGQLGAIALPIIAAVTLGANPFQMGLLSASGSLPRMLVGIFAGTWVDQRKRRPIMINVNLLRAGVLLVIPIASIFGILNFPLLLAVSVTLGMLGIIFDSAWSAMVPNLVDRTDLADANGKLWASMSLAQIAGPALAGTLIAWLTGPYVLAITAVGLLAAAYAMSLIQKPEPDLTRKVHTGRGEILRNIREGYLELIRNPIVRPLTTTMVGANFGSGIFSAVFVLLLTNELELSTRGVGVIYAMGGFGALVGSIVAAPWAKKYGFGKVIVIGPFIQGFSNSFFTVAVFTTQSVGVALVGIFSFIGWIFLQAYDINRFSLRQAVTRPNLMGRVASSTMTLIAAVMMLGSLVGGTIGQIWGLAPALALGALSQIAAGFLTLRSPIPAIKTLPRPEDIETIPVGDEPDSTDDVEPVVA
ncbi:MAG: MFS transporter [Thermomicrobiales bacterium]|nr:MFS transporter [Thermomicrobiales bacterium]MCO5225484.1 MFS transporter [Thermomicrobiales bacterium]MCO5227896.1 MFS transporter [Thermomicrobiales bacterium]